MKRYLMFLLVIISSLFLVLACSDSSSDDSGDNSSNTGGTGGNSSGNSGTSDSGTSGGDTGSNYTTPNIDNLSSLVGTYNIDFFYTNAMGLIISTDCANNSNYVDNYSSTSCYEVDHYGQATIEYTAGEGLNIISKMQLDASALETTGMASLIANSTYNYTVYTTIPESAIIDGVINSGDYAATGNTGRNLTSTVETTTSTYQFTLSGDTIINNMTDTSTLSSGVPVVVVYTKTSDTVVDLDPDTAYDEDTAGFTVDVQEITTTSN